MIPGTGCAVPCRVNIFTKPEIYGFDTTIIVSSAVGLSLIIIMLSKWVGLEISIR
jgi:hypothetical protein